MKASPGATFVLIGHPVGHSLSPAIHHAAYEQLVEKARTEDVPVLWVQHSSEDLPMGSEQWQYVPELVRRPGGITLANGYLDAEIVT